jgi:hypothetical protein
MERGYVQAIRSLDRHKAIWKRHRPTFWLLFFISQSAKREATAWIGPGQCEIRGHEDALLTLQEYKTAKRNLEKMGLAKFEKRNNVTLATLIDTTYYDINMVSKRGNQLPEQPDEPDLNNGLNNGELPLSLTDSNHSGRKKPQPKQRPKQRNGPDLNNNQPTLTNIRSKKGENRRISLNVQLIELSKERDEIEKYLRTYGNVNNEEQHKLNQERKRELLRVNQLISELKAV